MVWTANMIQKSASAWDRAELLRLWAAIKAGEASDWPAGRTFEHLVIRAFELEGVRVRWLERRPPGTMGVLFSSSGFSLLTERFAQYLSPMNFLFWGQRDLDYALPTGLMVAVLEAKMKYAIEFGIPTFTLGGKS